MEKTVQSFLVYLDLIVNGIVGNQVNDLLQEIAPTITRTGFNYIWPLHIQYLPVWSNIIRTIIVEVSVHKGELVKFGGDTIVTLNFKRQSLEEVVWKDSNLMLEDKRRNKRCLKGRFEWYLERKC